METFFKDVFLQESAIYTLWGTKPVTKIDIHYHLPTDPEVIAFYAEMSEEDKKNAIIFDHYDLPQNWEKWEKIRERFPIRQFLFFKQADLEDPKFASIYFVNIKHTISTLQDNYQLFQQETGCNFNPSKEVFEMEKRTSFWNKVFDNPVLVGILYGYGKENSFQFRRKYQVELSSLLEGCPSNEIAIDGLSPSYFSLPIFTSFAGGKDEVIEKFKEEREEIQKAYQGLNFLEVTLSKLMNVSQNSKFGSKEPKNRQKPNPLTV